MVKIITPHQWAKDKTPAEWANHHIKVVTILIVLLLLSAYPAGVFALSMLTAHHNSQASAAAPGDARPSGSGVVLSTNDTSMTVQHGGAPQIGLAAGTTGFPTAAPILRRTQVGDHVTFYLSRTNDGPWTITGLRNLDLEEMGHNPVLGSTH